MSYQEFIIIFLFIVSVTLAVLLIFRTRQSKKSENPIKKISQSEFKDYLLTNATDGSIVEVARRLSDLLIRTFECQSIIFLRKKRGVLELNYYHNIRNFNKTDFNIPFNPKLDSLFRQDYLPRNLKEIENLLPHRFIEKNSQYKFNRFFPVFWRENLYGVYFIKCDAEKQSKDYEVLLASLTQALSAAYHIKWHEAKKENLTKTIRTDTAIAAETIEGDSYVTKMLKLVKHKKTDTLVAKLIESLKDFTGIRNLAYIYENSSVHENPKIIHEGRLKSIKKIDGEFLTQVLNHIGDKPYYPIENIDLNDYLLNSWINSLKEKNIGYLASLPLTKSRKGLLVWTRESNTMDIEKRLDLFKKHSVDIVENVENFESVEEMSYTDSLTKLANQRYFTKRLKEEINRAGRYKRKLALIIFDVDELKSVNDRLGHLAGDALISEMGEILRNSIRAIDVVARYGGDEFCVIMPEADYMTCQKFMERLQETIRTAEINIENLDTPITCTISMGAAIFPDNADDDKKLIFAADMALLKAKEKGRNRYFISSTEHIT